MAVAAAACAGMGGSECRLADWRTIGYEDGASGAPAARIGLHRKACAAHGVAPDLAAYRDGRDAGLRDYCRPQHGFSLGERGAIYDGLCPPPLEPELLSAYRAGARLHTARTRVRAARARSRADSGRSPSIAR
jgi:hypothetical protein